MTAPAYPAAHLVAGRVRAHFELHREAARRAGYDELAPLPDVRAIEAIVDAAFWASLRREEGIAPKISLAFVEPDERRSLRFARPLPLTPGALTRLAAAVERPGIHLGVWDPGDGLQVWGATRHVPGLCFVVEVAEPGLLVVKHRRGEDTGKFVNVAVLEGDQVKVLDERAARLADSPAVLVSLLGFEPPRTASDTVDVLVQLAISMRGHRRGGALLVVPSGSDAWRASIVEPMPYAVVPPFPALAELLRHEASAPERVRLARDAEAGLTAVDGATLLTDAYEILGFGAMIARRDGSGPVLKVKLAEPLEGATPAVVDVAALGGARHQSAAQFVNDQHDALALVASMDGRFTVLAWAPSDGMVHAHRVETLLL